MQNQPYRRQSSLGGNVSYRNISANEDCSYIVLAKVTKVYYKLGRLDYKLVNTVSVVAGQPGDGSGAAPIPVDFFGYQPNGKPYGHYRPVQTGDLIALAFVKGHQSEPIVLGVYPNNTDAYEILSPAIPSTGDDHKESIAKTALSDQKIYPSGQMVYRSGSGEILKALNGHSYLAVSDEGLDSPNNFEQLWSTYDQVYDFYRGGSLIEPSDEKAGQWLLIHEDNPDADGADSHLTRFYVNKKGEFQIALMDNSFTGDTLMLTGSKNGGFTVTKYYDHPSKDDTSMPHGVGHNDDYQVPDFDNAKKYVRFVLGDQAEDISLEATSKDDSVKQSSQLTIKSDGIYINGKLLAKGTSGSGESTIIDKSIEDALQNSQELNDAIQQADEAQRKAQEAGQSAITTSQKVQYDVTRMKENMKYYLSISKDKDYDMGSKSDAWTKVFNDVYIENTNSLRITASNIEAGNIDATHITVNHLTLNEGDENHINANIIDTGTLNADRILARTITAKKINAPELSDITKRLGKIEGGSISIGKIDEKGKAQDPTTEISIDQILKYGAIAAHQNSQTFNIDDAVWTAMANRTATITVKISLENYFINTSFVPKDSDELTAGFRVELKTKSGDVKQDAQLDASTFYDGENIDTTTSISMRIPSDVTGGTIRVFGNIKVGKLWYGPITIAYSDPRYDVAEDAFTVDGAGNVTARSFKAPGGKIIGGEIDAETTINGSTINGARINGETIMSNGTITGSTIKGTNIYGTTVSGATLLSWSEYDDNENLISDYKSIKDIDDRKDDWFLISGNNLIWHTKADPKSKDDVTAETGDTSVLGTNLAYIQGGMDTSSSGKGGDTTGPNKLHLINGIGIQSTRPIIFGRAYGTIDGQIHGSAYGDGNYSGPQKVLDSSKKYNTDSFGIYSDGLQNHLFDGSMLAIGTNKLGKREDDDDGNARSSILAYISNSISANDGEFDIQKNDRVGAYFGELGSDKLGNHIQIQTNNGDVSFGTINSDGRGSEKVIVNGSFAVHGGNKNALVDTSQGSLAVNSYETPAYYFGDIGSAITGQDCTSIVGIDRIFNEMINTDREYQVFITPYSHTKFWVDQRNPHYFVVKSEDPNASFGWELKALRKGYEDIRLKRDFDYVAPRGKD